MREADYAEFVAVVTMTWKKRRPSVCDADDLVGAAQYRPDKLTRVTNQHSNLAHDRKHRVP